MTTVRYAPQGSTTEKTIQKELSTVLDNVREHTNPYEYSFHAVLNLPLQKGTVLHHKSFLTQKAGTSKTSLQNQNMVVASPPRNPDFLVPLSKKKLVVQHQSAHDGSSSSSSSLKTISIILLMKNTQH